MKPSERFAGGVSKPRAAWQWGRGEGIVGEDLARIGLQVSGDFREEHRAEFAQLLFAYAADASEIAFVGRIRAGHLAKGDIREDDISGHVAFIGQALAKLA